MFVCSKMYVCVEVYVCLCVQRCTCVCVEVCVCVFRDVRVCGERCVCVFVCEIVITGHTHKHTFHQQNILKTNPPVELNVRKFRILLIRIRISGPPE